MYFQTCVLQALQGEHTIRELVVPAKVSMSSFEALFETLLRKHTQCLGRYMV